MNKGSKISSLVSIIGLLFIIISLVGIISIIFLRLDYINNTNKLLKSNPSSNLEDTLSLDYTVSSSSSNEDGSGIISNDTLSKDQEVAPIKEGTPYISVSSVGIKTPILEGTDDNTLLYGAGHFKDSVEIGAKGNCGLAGHNSSFYSCVFNKLEDIEIYDKVCVYNEKGIKFEYTVIDKCVVMPDSWGVLADSENTKLTLLTCSDRGSMRLCVTCLLLTDEELVEYKISNSKQKVLDMKDMFDDNNNIELVEFFKSRELGQNTSIRHGFPQSAFTNNITYNYIDLSGGIYDIRKFYN